MNTIDKAKCNSGKLRKQNWNKRKTTTIEVHKTILHTRSTEDTKYSHCLIQTDEKQNVKVQHCWWLTMYQCSLAKKNLPRNPFPRCLKETGTKWLCEPGNSEMRCRAWQHDAGHSIRCVLWKCWLPSQSRPSWSSLRSHGLVLVPRHWWSMCRLLGELRFSWVNECSPRQLKVFVSVGPNSISVTDLVWAADKTQGSKVRKKAAPDKLEIMVYHRGLCT